MRTISVNDINGGEILAKNLHSDTGVLVMSEGAVLRTAYINRLRELGITKIDIIDAPMVIIVDKDTEEQIQNECAETVKEIIDKYSYSIDAELSEISDVANSIVQDVLQQQEVLYNISRVREKSQESYLHSVNVCALSVLIGIKMTMPERRIHNLAVGALLHDIGMVYVPVDAYDYETLDDNMKKEIKKHVIYGYSAVEKEEWLNSAAKDIIINHHERVDGSGYPFHLTGDKLSTESKIVSVCDEFDTRVYGIFTPREKVHVVLEDIMAHSGDKFDFKIVQLFVGSVAAFPVGTMVLTNDNETGVVIKQNRNFPTRPVIRIIKAGTKSKVSEEVDLLKSLDKLIINTIDSDI